MKLSLEKLKEVFPSGKLDHRGKNLITNCPECGEREFSISIEENHLCGCFRGKSCGWKGNVFTLMKKIGRVDILINKDIKFDKIETIKLYKENDTLNLDLPDTVAPMGWKRIYADPYLESRNFFAYDKYKVGVTNIHPKLAKDFVVFLIEESEKVKGYIGRNRKDKKEIEAINKYYKLKGINKQEYRYLNSLTDFGKLVYGLEEITSETKTLIIVEGIFDKFRINFLLNLYSQKEIVCVATFKCAVSKEQIFKIQERGINIETTILLYDPDVIDEIKKTAFELRSYMGNVLIGFASNGKDPGDYVEEDLEQVFSNLDTPTNFNVNKINLKKLKI